MIDTEILKRKILDLSIKGKLVPQDSTDEPASELLKRIKIERDRLIDEGKIKGKKDDFSYIFKGEDNCYYEKKGKEIRNITDDIPFEIPDSWAWSRIGSYSLKVTDFVASGSFKSLRENVAYYKKPNYALMIKTQDFQNNFSEDLTYTDEHGYNFLSNSNLYGGELILSNVGSVGKVYIVPHFNLKMTLAPNSIMVRFFDESLNLYLYYLLQSKFGYTCLKNITSATAIQKFNKTDFKTILVPIPPKNEQLRIINSLNTLSSKLDEINNLNVQIQLVKSQIKNKIIKLGIQGKLLNSNDNYYYEKMLSDVAKITMGQSIKSEEMDTVDAHNSLEFHQGKTYFTQKTISNSNIYTKHAKKTAEPNSILFSVRAPVGAINYCDRQIAIGRGLAAITPRKDLSIDYLYYLLFDGSKKLIENSTGTTFDAIKKEQLYNLKVLIPQFQTQERIIAIINKCLDTLLIM